ncbi:MAG: Gfo/Idh/MocA family oxidoreductase [Planctomycetes bacterium]|nr:Gfo/Idh/MocA family oxidoreductase [Planctomycetota bacterium]
MSIKAILVGLGGRAKSWFDTAKENSEVEFVGFVEPFKPNQERAVQQWGIAKAQIHPKLSDALAAEKADCVLDVTPPAAHEAIALEAFKAGLHVLGEKPLSDSRPSAKRMVAAAKAAKRRHMITQNYRFGATPRTAARLVKSGIVGKPGSVDIAFFMSWADAPGSHYVEKPYMFLTDMGIHHFDMIRYVMGAEVLAAQGLSWNYPWGWHKGDASHVIVFDCKGGLKAVHRGIGCTLGYRTSWNGEWRIEGPEGTLTWERDKLFFSREHRTPERKRQEIPLDPQPLGGQSAILAEFLAAIKENRAPECSSEDNLKSLDMVFAALESIKLHREVKTAELDKLTGGNGKAPKAAKSSKPKSKPARKKK